MVFWFGWRGEESWLLLAPYPLATEVEGDRDGNGVDPHGFSTIHPEGRIWWAMDW